jgi:hypothetical protein
VTPFFFKATYKSGVAVHVCNPSCSGAGGKRILSSRLALTKLARSYLKNKNKMKAKGLEMWLNGRVLA